MKNVSAGLVPTCSVRGDEARPGGGGASGGSLRSSRQAVACHPFTRSWATMPPEAPPPPGLLPPRGFPRWPFSRHESRETPFRKKMWQELSVVHCHPLGISNRFTNFIGAYFMQTDSMTTIYQFKQVRWKLITQP